VHIPDHRFAYGITGIVDDRFGWHLMPRAFDRYVVSVGAQSQGFLTPEEEDAVDALPENDRAMLLDGMQRFNDAADALLRAGTSLAEGSPSHES
jgi:hypothetical protein